MPDSLPRTLDFANTQQQRAFNRCRSAQVGELQVSVGDIIELAPVDEEEADDAQTPLALLQAIWQTKKGQGSLLS